jgi:hypothetical protein
LFSERIVTSVMPISSDWQSLRFDHQPLTLQSGCTLSQRLSGHSLIGIELQTRNSNGIAIAA